MATTTGDRVTTQGREGVKIRRPHVKTAWLCLRAFGSEKHVKTVKVGRRDWREKTKGAVRRTPRLLYSTETVSSISRGAL